MSYRQGDQPGRLSVRGRRRAQRVRVLGLVPSYTTTQVDQRVRLSVRERRRAHRVCVLGPVPSYTTTQVNQLHSCPSKGMLTCVIVALG